MNDQYKNAASTLGGPPVGLERTSVRQGELAKIAERINLLGKRAAELNSRLMGTADRLFGSHPVGETGCVSDCRVGETGAIHDAIDHLEAMINGSENEAARLSQL